MENKTTTVSKYKDRLAQSQDLKEEQKIQFKVEKTNLQLKGTLLSTQEKLAQARLDLESLKGQYPLDPQAVINKKNDVRDLENGEKDIQDLIAELM
jgi:ACT domain-containing protein